MKGKIIRDYECFNNISVTMYIVPWLSALLVKETTEPVLTTNLVGTNKTFFSFFALVLVNDDKFMMEKSYPFWRN